MLPHALHIASCWYCRSVLAFNLLRLALLLLSLPLLLLPYVCVEQRTGRKLVHIAGGLAFVFIWPVYR
jgi:hypothetical protein